MISLPLIPFVHSFFCNEGTEFDQQLLTCVHEAQDRSACSNARQFYESSNSQFFRTGPFNGAEPPTPNPGPSGDDSGVILIGVTGGVPAAEVPSAGGQGSAGDQVTDAGLQGQLGNPDLDEGSTDGAGKLNPRIGLPSF